MSRLEVIAAHGNRGRYNMGNNLIVCADGTRLSVLAGAGSACSPRPSRCRAKHDEYNHTDPCLTAGDDVPCDYEGPYDEVEVGYPTVRPEPWEEWSAHFVDDGDPDAQPIRGVYLHVPVKLVEAFVAAHGGEVPS